VKETKEGERLAWDVWERGFFFFFFFLVFKDFINTRTHYKNYIYNKVYTQLHKNKIFTI
jgi:hypothetical protein